MFLKNHSFNKQYFFSNLKGVKYFRLKRHKAWGFSHAQFFFKDFVYLDGIKQNYILKKFALIIQFFMQQKTAHVFFLFKKESKLYFAIFCSANSKYINDKLQTGLIANGRIYQLNTQNFLTTITRQVSTNFMLIDYSGEPNNFIFDEFRKKNWPIFLISSTNYCFQQNSFVIPVDMKSDLSALFIYSFLRCQINI